MWCLIWILVLSADDGGAIPNGMNSPSDDSDKSTASAEVMAGVLDGFLGSVTAIENFDCHLDIKHTWLLEHQVRDDGSEKLIEVQTPLSSAAESYRQVFEASGRRRIEELSDSDEIVTATTVVTGELERTLVEPQNTGYIGPLSGGGLDEGYDYATSFILARSATLFSHLCEERRQVLSLHFDHGLWVLELPPHKPSYPSFGWKLWLDPEHSLFPIRIQKYYKSSETVVSELTVDRFHEFSVGLYAPEQYTLTSFQTQPDADFYMKPVAKMDVVVDLNQSSWNQPLAEDLFRLPFPKGTHVTDSIRNIQFISGEDSGDTIDRLLETAMAKSKMADLNSTATIGPPPEQRLISGPLLWFNVVFALAIAAYWGISQRRVQ